MSAAATAGEVRQTKHAAGRSIGGHLHFDNLQTPDAGVGGGPARTAAEWTGVEAAAVKAVLPRVCGAEQQYLCVLAAVPRGNPSSPGRMTLGEC